MKRSVLGVVLDTVLSTVLSFALLALTAAVPLEARAGGGGGGGRDGGILVLALLAGGYSVATSLVIRRKNREAEALLEQLAKTDAHWAPEGLKARLEATYFRVQYAWRDRDQTAAEPYMSRRLYDKHELQLADMRA